VICVLHDLAQIRAHFPDCLLIARSCIAWGKTGVVLTPEHLHAARHFHASWEPLAAECEV
jgi:zinc/manganese transport system ATP-binding protein